MKYYTKELIEIFNQLSIELTSYDPLDVIIKIFKRYRDNPNVEDLTLLTFLGINYPSQAIKDKLIDELIKYKSFNKVKVKIEEVVSKAEEYSKMYPQAVGNVVILISSSHFVLATLDLIQDVQSIMKGQFGAGLEELKMESKNNEEYYKKLVDTTLGIMDKLFPKSPFNTNNKKDDYNDGMDMDPDDLMESMGFPLPGGELFKKKGKQGELTMLEKYAKELTAEDSDPVYGRENELSQLLEILGCKKKNNAILIGEPGVGKTSVVELLSQRIKEKRVPHEFIGKRIFSLDLNSLVAGTKYRGQYEERLQSIIEEVVSNKDIIIFIDEIHNLIGNGGSEGSGDAANILKPYLAKGKFQCIGSTTFREYRKHIEKDGALKRRFQNVIIEEPTLSQTETILNQIKDVYEKHHNVIYPKEVIEACVKMSARYLTDRYFPDKAIDLLDLSGSLARLSQSTMEIDNYLNLSEEVDMWREKKNKAVIGIKFPDAIKYRDKEREAQKKLQTPVKTIKATLQDVYKAVGKRSGIPLENVGSSDLDKLRNLYQVLPSRVIGQEKAIKEVIMSLQKNSLGIRDPQKPIASLLFVGPTGSGKTYLCKTLAKEFFGSEEALIKYDMSEFGQDHEITKLTGAAASYIGYDDEPGFERVRKHPYSVVLFDEIEKASPKIYQIFLSILDEGYITLSNGIKVNFKNTIIIFTGNIGTKELSLFGSGVGYESVGSKTPDKTKKDSIINKSIEKTFAPEFINRLSKIIIFESLGKEELTKIIDLELSKLSTRLKESKITIKVTKSLKDYIISRCDPKYGARDLQREISKNIEEVLCDKLLSSDIPDGSKTFSLDYKSDQVTIELKLKKKKSDGGEKLLCDKEDNETRETGIPQEA